MSSPFVAEIRIFAGNFAPRGWAFCNGQVMPISQNTALFSLLGTTYGGDGKSTFALPNLQGMAPLQQGQGPGLSLRDLGETGGEQMVTLTDATMPSHRHTVNALDGNGDQSNPANTIWGKAATGRQGVNIYTQNLSNNVGLNPLAFAAAGGSQPHNNMPPYLALSFIIALQGIYPPRS
jgi:microcystin-dependent protein